MMQGKTNFADAEGWVSFTVQAAVVAMSARFNVMDSMEKRVRSRFSHRRDIVLELAVEEFDSPDSGPMALLQSLLSIPVSS